jgi:hypothetical protein
MRMKTCNHGHPQIAYLFDEDERSPVCPLCEALKSLAAMTSEANRMGRENDNLCDENFELKQKIKELGEPPEFLSQALNEGDGVYRP